MIFMFEVILSICHVGETHIPKTLDGFTLNEHLYSTDSKQIQ